MPAPAALIPEPRRTWYRRAFLAAAIYNLIWDVAVVLFPRVGLGLAGIGPERVGPVGVLFWQCIGMFVMVFAIGYHACWRDPERYAPFILIGALGKLFGPVGFLYGWLYLGELPGRLGLTLLTNDLMWWPAFFPFVWETMLRPRRSR